ncbi:MAG: SP family arabinose:H+ symporter-like MFS transporter [Bacteroidia bacterium]|jgi:SP family arabinose:H+ symporter-like MFS transporter
MAKKSTFTYKVAAIVALGGLLMGFDASVISGVNKFVQIDFNLTDLQLGFSVSSLTIVASLAMMFAGPISDRFGRRVVLKACAVIFTISAIGSALAPNFTLFLIFRMLGGIGVGASLILAPMYIAEIAPPAIRGKMVSFNQLNIVIGISLAFFTNYLIISLADSDATWVESLGIGEHNWRWMLGIEALPAVLYFFGLYSVPRSPRWLAMKGKIDEALQVMKLFRDEKEAEEDIKLVQEALKSDKNKKKASIKSLLMPSLKVVLTIGLVIGILQQITGINSVFFYAPMIFEQSGIGTDASFIQAILVGLTNLVFTILAMLFIDKLGRKPLLVIGVSGIAIFMFLLAYGFNSANYSLKQEKLSALSSEIDQSLIMPLVGIEFSNDVEYKNALKDLLGPIKSKQYESELITAAIDMNPMLILIGIIGFVASFAISLGPVMWVLFSELFPLHVRGIAISAVGFVNSAVSAGVQFVFPWELSTIGSSATFLIYGLFALLGLVFIIFKVPETKGKSLEELEAILVK